MAGDGVRFGEFQLLRRLGAGGMAEVFLARREGPQGFEKHLVVKRLLPHLARSERFTQMLLREARYSALIDHPNFVHVSSFGVIDDGYYLAMEYVDGLTIQELLGVVGSLSAGVAARVAIDLLDALHAIHTAKYLDGRELRLVHRDVTPGNVMVTAAGTVKVLDLGIAVPVDEVAPGRAGTRRYMSPEQARGEPLDARSDLYCVGLVLCLMLSGRHPFMADELSVTLDQSPPMLRDVIVDILQEERDARPRTAREVQARLEAFAVTRGQEGTRAYLSELATEVVGAKPPPSPRQATVSFLLSAVVPEDLDADDTEAPTRASGASDDALIPPTLERQAPDEITAIGAQPAPVGSGPLADPAMKDTVEEGRPIEVLDVLDTLELAEDAAKDALHAIDWPVSLFEREAAPTLSASAPQPATPTEPGVTEAAPDTMDAEPPVEPTRLAPTLLREAPTSRRVKKGAGLAGVAVALFLLAVVAAAAAWSSY